MPDIVTEKSKKYQKARDEKKFNLDLKLFSSYISNQKILANFFTFNVASLKKQFSQLCWSIELTDKEPKGTSLKRNLDLINYVVELTGLISFFN